MRCLSLKETADELRSGEFRLKQRNLEVILFLTTAYVKENRKLLLCKWSDARLFSRALFVTSTAK